MYSAVGRSHVGWAERSEAQQHCSAAVVLLGFAALSPTYDRISWKPQLTAMLRL